MLVASLFPNVSPACTSRSSDLLWACAFRDGKRICVKLQGGLRADGQTDSLTVGQWAESRPDGRLDEQLVGFMDALKTAGGGNVGPTDG